MGYPHFYGKNGIYTSPRLPISLPTDTNFSIVEFLFRDPSSIVHSPALIDSQTLQTFTFSDLKNHTLALSNALLTLNISKNDIVLIFSPNSIIYPVVFFAVAAIGAIATTCNPQYTKPELAKQVRDSKPKLVVTTHELYDKIKHLNLPCIMLSGSAPTTTKTKVYYYSNLVQPYLDKLPSSMKLPSIEQTDAAAIMYTSGTTGMTKGAVLTHRNLMASALMMTCDEKTGSGLKNVVLCFLPMYHIFGLSGVVLAHLQRGDAVVSMSRYKINEMLRVVEMYKVTHLYIVPPVGIELAKKRELVKNYNVSSLRFILSGGAPITNDIMIELAAIFPKAVLYQGYGMTEAAGIIALGDTRKGLTSFDSLGMLAPGVEARIINLTTKKPLPPLENGEIWIRGPMVMKGYLNNDKATLDTIDSDGWLKTGDIGYFDNEGHLYIVDRVKELIKYKGFQVAPAELEQNLLMHPDVVDCAVLGVPDNEAGEVPIAYVVLKQGSSLTTKKLQEFIAKQVAPFKRLRSVVFIDAIPKSPTGKVLKMELKQQYISKL